MVVNNIIKSIFKKHQKVFFFYKVIKNIKNQYNKDCVQTNLYYILKVNFSEHYNKYVTPVN